jgi:hypothetical protein
MVFNPLKHNEWKGSERDTAFYGGKRSISKFESFQAGLARLSNRVTLERG